MLDRLPLPRWTIAVTLLLCVAGSGTAAAGGEMLADPTRPPVSTAGDSPQTAGKALKWRLTSTIVGPGRRVAVINDRVVQTGESIDGAVLVAVSPGGALLRQGKRTIHLQLNAEAVKRTAIAAP